MNIANNLLPTKYIALLTINCVLYMPFANADEWLKNDDYQSSFSEFAPPAEFNEYSDKSEKRHWRSGSSFKNENKTRYAPVKSRNPWKVVSSMHYKKSFNTQRPWGNVPERKPATTNNMKFYDQKFKQWSHQRDASYRNNFTATNPFNTYRSSVFPFSNNYGYPGGAYNRPLITPSIYPAYMPNAQNFGGYPGNSNQYNAMLSSPWGWQ